MGVFLGERNLIYLWQKIKKHVSDSITALNLSGTYQAKETGKGLSTNDYTTAEKNKLSGIATGAEVNVQANWAETDSSDDAFIKNKPSIPSKVSDLTNDTGFITSADVPEGAAASVTTPLMDGTASVGSETAFARGDHRHPTDTSRQAAITSSNKLNADLIEDGTTNKTVTASEKSTWNSKYSKPSGGISKDDLASAVQTSLGKADTALQSESDPVFTAHVAHGITSTDISNWNAAEANIVKSVNTTAGTSGVNLSLSNEGALDVTISSGSIASGNSNFVTGGTVYSTTSTLAPKASPTFTGTPIAPTADPGTNTQQIATTAFVTAAVSAASAGVASFQGTVNAAATITGSDYKKGWYWAVAADGTYVGQTCEVGDFIFAIADKGSAYKASDFSVVQNNMDMQEMTEAEMDTATNNWT